MAGWALVVWGGLDLTVGARTAPPEGQYRGARTAPPSPAAAALVLGRLGEPASPQRVGDAQARQPGPPRSHALRQVPFLRCGARWHLTVTDCRLFPVTECVPERKTAPGFRRAGSSSPRSTFAHQALQTGNAAPSSILSPWEGNLSTQKLVDLCASYKLTHQHRMGGETETETSVFASIWKHG